jgi:hypothetical protein
MSAIVCPKCQYLRKQTEEAPLWQCPSCNVAYNKVESPKFKTVAASQATATIAEESPVEPVGRAEAVRTWAILIIVIGILPWSYFCITSLGPALGIQHMGVKSMIFSIIAVPALLIWFASWLTSLYE